MSAASASDAVDEELEEDDELTAITVLCCCCCCCFCFWSTGRSRSGALIPFLCLGSDSCRSSSSCSMSTTWISSSSCLKIWKGSSEEAVGAEVPPIQSPEGAVALGRRLEAEAATVEGRFCCAGALRRGAGGGGGTFSS